MLLYMQSVQAVDNPDAPDYQAAFLARAKPYEERLSDAAGGGAGLTDAAVAYARFLDTELNQAYRQLLGRLDALSRQALVSSQRRWLAFRDAEIGFIDENWTPRNFGSSSVFSRADYRATLVKQRVLVLLAYLRNYPVSGR